MNCILRPFRSKFSAERPGPLDRIRPGHDHVAVALAPFDVKLPAVELQRSRAAGEAPSRAGDKRGAGAGAAGLGLAGAALPDLQADTVAALGLGAADVDALGAQRVMLDQGAGLAH